MNDNREVLYRKMNVWRAVCIGLLGVLLGNTGTVFAQSGGGPEHVAAKLFADVSSIQPDRAFQVGVLLQIDPGYHIYWINPGDSGSATRLSLHLPAGFTAEPVQYPVPLRMTSPGDVVNFGYENEVMLVARVTPAPQLMQEKPTDQTITADLHYLVCNADRCLPGSARLSVTLPMAAAASPSSSADLFRQWADRMPKLADPSDVSGITCDVQLAESGNKASATVRLQWSVALPGDIQFFPAPVKGFDLSDVKVATTGLTTTCSFELTSPSDALLPPKIDTVVAFKPENQPRIGLAVPVPSINRQDMPPAVPPASP